MVQRDYLEVQIEQLGRALGRIVAEFPGTRARGSVSEAIEVTNESLKAQLDLDVDCLVGQNTSNLANYLAQRNLSGERLAPLAEYLVALAEHKMATHRSQALAVYRSVLQLYEIMDTTTDLRSLERFAQEEKINRILEQA